MATVRTWIAPHRLLLPALLIALIALGPARPARAQQPPQAGAALPDEEDGSFTDNEDPADVSSTGAAAAGPRVVAPPPAPCPLVGAAVVVPPGPPPPCAPCPLPVVRIVAPPEGPQIPVVPPPGPCINPSVRAVQGAVNLANQVEVVALRTLDPAPLTRVYVKGAYWQVAGFVDELAWRGHYANARLLGVRHLDTQINGRIATSRSIERWEYREYDLFTGELVYSALQTVENRWTLVKVDTRWMVADIQISQR